MSPRAPRGRPVVVGDAVPRDETEAGIVIRDDTQDGIKTPASSSATCSTRTRGTQRYALPERDPDFRNGTLTDLASPITGRRPPANGAQPAGVAVFAPERFYAHDLQGGDAALRGAARSFFVEPTTARPSIAGTSGTRPADGVHSTCSDACSRAIGPCKIHERRGWVSGAE